MLGDVCHYRNIVHAQLYVAIRWNREVLEKFLNNKQFLGVGMKIAFLEDPFSLQRVLIPNDAPSVIGSIRKDLCGLLV